MADHTSDPHHDSREAARRALLAAALTAYEDAGLSGLCAEGRWEAAVDAMRALDLTTRGNPTSHLTSGLSEIISVVGGASAPPPSGGSVAAAAGALAAALTRMVAGLTAGRPRYAGVAAEMQHIADQAATLAAELVALVEHDAAAVEAIAAAFRLPKTTDAEASARGDAIERAMRSATEAPFEIARAAAAVAELAAVVAQRGNTNAVADAAVAALLAESVCRASSLTVRVNVPALRDAPAGHRLDREAVGFAEAASGAAARAAAAVERAIARAGTA